MFPWGRVCHAFWEYRICPTAVGCHFETGSALYWAVRPSLRHPQPEFFQRKKISNLLEKFWLEKSVECPSTSLMRFGCCCRPPPLQDNFSTAEYIMQVDVDVVVASPVTDRTLFDVGGRPFLPFFLDVWTPWTDLSAELFGNPQMQFMAYFPAVATPAALRTVREVVSRRYALPFDLALWRPAIFSQFDLIGHAMAALGHTTRPCHAFGGGEAAEWCRERPSPVVHVPYKTRCLLAGSTEQVPLGLLRVRLKVVLSVWPTGRGGGGDEGKKKVLCT